jgi:hypothetical protein
LKIIKEVGFQMIFQRLYMKGIKHAHVGGFDFLEVDVVLWAQA